MIDPRNITHFDRTNAELAELFMFAVLVAGKNSDRIAHALESILQETPGTGADDKLHTLVRTGTLDAALRRHGIGQYRRIGMALGAVEKRLTDDPDFLRTATVDDLEALPGCGCKTSRFVILHSRPDQHGIAVLDTHVLAWLRSLGINAPKLSPTGKTYARLERVIVEICRVTGVSPAQLDLAIWRERQRRRHLDTKTAA